MTFIEYLPCWRYFTKCFKCTESFNSLNSHRVKYYYPHFLVTLGDLSTRTQLAASDLASEPRTLWLNCPHFLGGEVYNLQDLSSLTKDQTCASCSGSTESYPLDCQGSPCHTLHWTSMHLHVGLLIHLHSVELSHSPLQACNSCWVGRACAWVGRASAPNFSWKVDFKRS